MKQKEMTCCICGEKIPANKFGNNPFGAIDDTGKIIQFDSEQVCCDKCNAERVIPGRLAIRAAESVIGGLSFKTYKECVTQLRLYSFIVNNWDTLNKYLMEK